MFHDTLVSFAERRIIEMKKEISNDPVIKASIITFFCGIGIHLFGLINVLHNYDDIYVRSTDYGAGLSLGRWVLDIVGNFFIKNEIGYNLPYVNGAMFIMILAVTTGVLMKIFDLQSWKLGVMTGLSIVSFPAITSTLFFKYTTIYYGIAILFSVVAVWVLKIRKYGIIISSVCIAVSLGIYQAYLPLTIALLVLCLIKQILEENIDLKSFIKRGMSYCLSLIGGIVSLLYWLEIVS